MNKFSVCQQQQEPKKAHLTEINLPEEWRLQVKKNLFKRNPDVLAKIWIYDKDEKKDHKRRFCHVSHAIIFSICNSIPTNENIQFGIINPSSPRSVVSSDNLDQNS